MVRFTGKHPCYQGIFVRKQANGLVSLYAHIIFTNVPKYAVFHFERQQHLFSKQIDKFLCSFEQGITEKQSRGGGELATQPVPLAPFRLASKDGFFLVENQ